MKIMSTPLAALCSAVPTWQGGLRDRTLAVSNQQREAVMPAIEATIEAVKAKVFPYHSL